MYFCNRIVKWEMMDNSLEDKSIKRHGRSCLRPWKELRFGGRVLRVLWVALAAVVLFTWLQVLLGRFINPPLTPLMIQRYFQQLSDKERPVNFERDYVSLKNISPNLVTAVVYAEDGWFMYHHGFDVKQMKIAYCDHHSGRRTRGASTISQQTAKNAFLPHSRNLLRKAVEVYYTTLIEAVWGKRRIMEVYLNIAEFGDGIYGCEAASQHYFGHSAAKLSRNEAAQLAATLPSPLKRNPAHQTPYFRRYAASLRQRFAWGTVDLDMPKAKRRKKAPEQENLVQFFIWTLKQK